MPGGTSSNIGTQALCRLSQNNLLRLVIPVPERAVPDLHLGEKIDVKVSTTGKTFTGRIIRVSDQIDLQTRTMHTEVEVPNPSYELVPGMYASAEIPLQTAQKALTLPMQAVQPTGPIRGPSWSSTAPIRSSDAPSRLACRRERRSRLSRA